MNQIARKWWFALPVIVLTVASTFWLSRALGLGDYPLKPLTAPRIVLFSVSFYSFLQLYSYLIRAIVRWIRPAALSESDT